MLKNLKKRSQGFTIIEVLIVLAIAGLILLIVFLAVPALQRNSRNTRVKDDASKSAGALQETSNNNNGTLPTGTTAPQAVDPANANYGQVSAVNYNVHATAFQSLGATIARDTLYVRNFSVCGANGSGQAGLTGGSQRQVTVTYLIESPNQAANGVAPAGFIPQCTVGS